MIKTNDSAMIANRIMDTTRVEHPQPFVIAAPNFRCLPLLVNGIPVFLDIFCFTLVIPTKRFHENPPLLGIIPPLTLYRLVIICILIISSKIDDQL